MTASFPRILLREVKWYKGVVRVVRTKGEERKPKRCNNIDDLLSIVDVDY